MPILGSGGVSRVVCVPNDAVGEYKLYWKVKHKYVVNPSTTICVIKHTVDQSLAVSINSPGYGWVSLIQDEGSVVSANCGLFNFEPCQHQVVMKDLCAECGANLRRAGGCLGERNEVATAKIPMVHTFPDLHVSEHVAAEIALQDQQSLLAARKLVLLVDLDQTIIHTTSNAQGFNFKKMDRYHLPGSPLIYHTRFRPHLFEVLDTLSKYYQMHICTFGNRVYAHKLAELIDPRRRFFCHRILSRDEFFNPMTKSANLRALFPRGLNLVCIIDDRGEVWDWSPNLIQVKPYQFFPDTGDINAPPWAAVRPELTTTTKKSSNDVITAEKSNCNESLDDESSNLIIQSDSTDKLSKFSSDTGDITTADVCPESSAATEKCSDANKPGDVVVENFDLNESCDNECLTSIVETDCNHRPSDSTQYLTLDAPTATINCTLTESTDITSLSSSNETTSLTDADRLTQRQQQQNDQTNEPDDDHAPGVPSSTISIEEEELDKADDRYLLRLQEILLSIHRTFFRRYDQWSAQQFSENQLRSDHLTGSPSVSSSESSPRNSQLSGIKPTNSMLESDLMNGLPHIADIIAEERLAVLGPECHITLSCLAPTHIPADRCLAGRIVRSLGAVLHLGLHLPRLPDRSNVERGRNKVGPSAVATDPGTSLSNDVPSTARRSLDKHSRQTTHLVACRRGTEKVNAASEFLANHPEQSDRLARFHLVSPKWLWMCHFMWEHVPESNYPLAQDHDPSQFDSAMQPIPGTALYSKRLRHYHRHRHHHHRSSHSVIKHDESRRQHHGSSGHKYDRKRRYRSNSGKTGEEQINPEFHGSDVIVPPCLNNVQLDVNIVRSALDDLRAEFSASRKRRRGKRRRMTEPSTEQNESTTTLGSNERQESVTVDVQNNISVVCEDQPVTTTQQIAQLEATCSSCLPMVKDTDEQDFDETANGNVTEEGTDMQSDTDDTESQLRKFLPPPKPLILADNPLLHLPPQAPGQMLAEIEDAVMEEETEKATRLPIETEQYDPAAMGLDDTTSSNSSVPPSECDNVEGDYMDIDINPRRGHSQDQLSDQYSFVRRHETCAINPSEMDSQTLHWQVQRELLLRRRHRASPQDVKKINRKLRVIDAVHLQKNNSTLISHTNRHRRAQSVNGLPSIWPLRNKHRKRPIPRTAKDFRMGGTNDTADSSEDECDIWDSEYPKGWSSEELARNGMLQSSGSTSRLFPHSPAIHSDPELTGSWWRLSIEDEELKEWNTCPEGYDYADAEQNRELLLHTGAETARDVAIADSRRKGHVNLSECLFGVDEDEGSGEEEEDEVLTVSSFADADSDYPDLDDDLTDERWDPLREYM